MINRLSIFEAWPYYKYIPSVLAPPAANAGINTNLVFGNLSTLLTVILLGKFRKDLRGW